MRAQNNDKKTNKPQDSLNYQQLEQVEVSATLSQTTPAASTVIIPIANINSQKIQESNPVDLVATLNQVPGLYMHSGAINTNRITIRGVGSRTLYGTNKIRAYFNGIPITNGGGETSIDSFDPENLQYIEVVKGPKATEYGTNLGGTLLLATPTTTVGKTNLKSSIILGSFGLLKNTITAASATKKISFNLHYDHLQTNGFRENNNYNRKALLFTSTYTINGRNSLSLLAKYTDYFAQIPSSLGKTAFEEEPTQAANNWRAAQGFEDNKHTVLGLSFKHIFSKNLQNTTSVFYNYLDHYEPRPFNILDEYTNGYGARTVFNANWKLFNKNSTFRFGGEIFKDEYHWKTIENLYEENNGKGSKEGTLLSDNFEVRSNLNAFANLILPISEKLKTQIGLNFNTTAYKFTDNINTGAQNKDANRNFSPIVAPNFNLLYAISNSANAYLSISRGFNYPSIGETLTPDGVINPSLGPETGNNFEIGTNLSFFKRKLKIQATTYVLKVKDLIVADRVGEDEYIGRNAGKTTHKGVELQTNFKHNFTAKFAVAPYFNAEFTDHVFTKFIDGENNYSGNQLTGVPSVKLNGGLNFIIDKFTVNTNFIHLGEIPITDSNSLYSNKYSVFNFKARYIQQLGQHFELQFNLGVDNMFDKKYASSILINATSFGSSEPRYYYPGRPRNYFGGVKLKVTL
tara:strand:- start:2806 stop:4866 length:2061 start_codon:yes stop_codon:yes gene_type:complete